MTGSYRIRSREAELLDDPGISEREIHRNMAELEVINDLLGGHKVTLNGIEGLAKNAGGTLSVTDVGCGAGDTLMKIGEWSKKKGIQISLKGIDLQESAISYAQAKNNRYGVTYIHGNALELDTGELEADVITCNMVCHHLYDETLRSLVRKMVQSARLGVVINDLHRHPVAFHSIKLLTSLFSKSVLVRNDAPLSVRKGFVRPDLEELCRTLGVDYSLRWAWAFRYLLVIRKQ